MSKDENNDNPQRKLIVEAALMSIAEKKISGTTMRDIAALAGISHGTLHYHYPSKAELLKTLLDEIDFIFNHQRSEDFVSVNYNPTASLKVFFQQEKDLLDQQRHVAEVFIDFWGHGHTDTEVHRKIQSMYKKWRQDIEEVIAEGIRQGDFDLQSADFIPFFMVSIMEGAVLQFLIDEEEFDLGAYFDQAFEMIIRFIVDQPGKKNSYPTDLKDEKWALIAPMLQTPEGSTGRPRKVDLREVVNAIIYQSRSGCSWRMLPHDFPQWKTVHGYFNNWREDGTLACISDQLGIELG
jgi:TetR/AcrR family transcriptional regulator